MHYCTLLITKELPSEDEIAKIMIPYREWDEEIDEGVVEDDTYPVFAYDWYVIGGRYGGILKLKVDDNDEYYKWEFYAKEERNKRLFYSSCISDIKRAMGKSWMYREEELYAYMGFRDGFLYVDGARVDDILNFDELNCCICIDVNGHAIARESWNGHDFIKDEHFDEKLEQIKKNSKGMFVTVLDIHD